MRHEPVINVEGADFDSGLEALALNSSFRPDSPILRLRVRINWQPEDPRAALGQGAVQGSGADFVRKLDELDKLAEGKKISEEKYKTARKALFKEYYPELDSGVDDPPDT